MAMTVDECDVWTDDSSITALVCDAPSCGKSEYDLQTNKYYQYSSNKLK